MTYELAKQLKDAGYIMKNEFAYKPEEMPTLSELIEACGDKFFELMQVFPNRWLATGESDSDGEGSGSTPEEAVANLWIELNKPTAPNT